jgi:hypothetical protein
MPRAIGCPLAHALTFILERICVAWTYGLSLRLSCKPEWYSSEAMVGKIVVFSTLIASVVLMIVLQTTNPSTAGPLGLLAVFFLLYVIFIGVTTELVWVGSHVVSWLSRRLRTRRPVRTLPLNTAYYYSTVLALGPAMMLAMQSIGSLGIYEILLIVAFLAVGILYVSRRIR